jgi:hypothetical protein
MPPFVDAIRFALSLSLLGFTDNSVNAVWAARKHAVERCQPDISPEHILYGVATLRCRCAARAARGKLGLNLAHQANGGVGYPSPPWPGSEAVAESGDRARPKVGREVRRDGAFVLGTARWDRVGG